MKILLIVIGILLAIQLIRPEKTNQPINESIALKAPKEVMTILKASCYDCHSDETKWPFYSDIAPISWSVIAHVNDGREALNFSRWSEIDPETKTKRLKRAIKTVNNGMMPLSDYLMFHDEAILDNDKKQIIVDWCNAQLAN